MKKSALKKIRGLTLIEVLIAVAFISLLYAFIVQVFFHGFRNVDEGDIQNGGVRLARNEMVRLSSIENPLFIGLETMDGGEELIVKLKAKEITAYDLVDQGIIELNVRSEIRKETTENSDDIKKTSHARAVFTRITEWQVDDVSPALVHIWITVSWEDPQQEFHSDKFMLETMFSQ